MDVTALELGIARAVGSSLITNCQVAYTQSLALGVPSGRVTLIQNGVDTTKFTPEHAGGNIRDAIGIAADTPLIGYVSRLEYEKGADLFIRIADYVHQFRPDVHFVLVGNGPQYKELSDMCTYMQLKQQVHFAGWWTDAAGIYPSLDLMVHTTRSDGTSLVVLEAMSCACPVAALAVGGVPELIESGSTGVLSAANDWQSLGGLIVQLLEQPEHLKVMGAAARAYVQQHFELKTNVRRTTEVLRHAASGSVNGQSPVTHMPDGERVETDSRQ
jgi:glycosyltransferase involved in cell wall biosynthesis